jgi:hypothetical protein
MFDYICLASFRQKECIEIIYSLVKLKLSDILNTIGVILFLACGYIAINGTTIFHTGDELALLPTWEFLLFFFGALIGGTFLIVFNLIRKNYKPSYLMIAIFSFLFVSGLLTIIAYKNGTVYSFNKSVLVDEKHHEFIGELVSFTYSIDPVRRLTFILQMFLLIFGTFLIAEVMPKVLSGKTFIAIGCLVVLAFATFCCVYSYIKEHDLYPLLLQDFKEGELFLHAVSSIYPNKNYYGFLLFLAIVASLYLHQYKGHWWWVLPVAFFSINLIFTWDKSALIIASFILLTYFIFRFIITYKAHPKRNIITLFVTVGTLFLLLIGLKLVYALNNEFRDAFINSFTQRGLGSMEGRRMIWILSKKIFDNSNSLFGAGYKIFADLIYIYNTTDSPTNTVYAAHNGYYEVIGEGGLVMLIAYFFITAYIIYLCVKHFKEHKSIALFTMTIITAMFGYMLVESGTYLFPQTLDYAFLSMIVCMPIISIHAR